MSQVIKVWVSGRPERLYLGMKVKHALGPRLSREVRDGRAVVRDQFGQVDLDGALYDGQRLVVEPDHSQSLRHEHGRS